MEVVDSGVVHIDDIKTFAQILEESSMSSTVLEHNIKMLKKRRLLEAGVDYIKTNLKVEKYTPRGIEKILKGLEES